MYFFLFSFDTYDVVRSWSIFLLPSIVLDNLFAICKNELKNESESECCINNHKRFCIEIRIIQSSLKGQRFERYKEGQL